MLGTILSIKQVAAVWSLYSATSMSTRTVFILASNQIINEGIQLSKFSCGSAKLTLPIRKGFKCVSHYGAWQVALPETKALGCVLL